MRHRKLYRARSASAAVRLRPEPERSPLPRIHQGRRLSFAPHRELCRGRDGGGATLAVGDESGVLSPEGFLFVDRPRPLRSQEWAALIERK